MDSRTAFLQCTKHASFAAYRTSPSTAKELIRTIKNTGHLPVPTVRTFKNSARNAWPTIRLAHKSIPKTTFNASQKNFVYASIRYRVFCGHVAIPIKTGAVWDQVRHCELTKDSSNYALLPWQASTHVALHCRCFNRFVSAVPVAFQSRVIKLISDIVQLSSSYFHKSRFLSLGYHHVSPYTKHTFFSANVMKTNAGVQL